ncbi:uncharacterized protein LOC110602197 [Manihot esculenta]|uniref:EG5651 n=1 Tax=Manihot esculenta TaxID=3983 RepID=U3GP03_MANES|nr:uncharacterized protein LOC110602197 [Manihot esculenta]AGT97364.1 EG5651 [Manihot esculenta]AGT97365.1 EG5651 [Manihot esculenta]AGT97366.1 EG5651 [Manihot esculenta]AGT97367.1 EG5651 [Manihot esculenta]AGT97368.1 EG5651 [Manihot esculenta]
MDAKEVHSEVSEELTRETLIGISYLLPEKVQNSDVDEILNAEKSVSRTNSDGADKYRSELISISYCPSPDMMPSPVIGKP